MYQRNASQILKLGLTRQSWSSTRDDPFAHAGAMEQKEGNGVGRNSQELHWVLECFGTGLSGPWLGPGLAALKQHRIVHLQLEHLMPKG